MIEKGRLALRAPTPQAVDYYLSQGFSQEGRADLGCRMRSRRKRRHSARSPCASGIRMGKVVDTVRSVEPVTD